MPDVTIRRSLQQIKHCVEEAISVIENREDLQQALDDIEHAQGLIQDTVLPYLRENTTDSLDE